MYMYFNLVLPRHGNIMGAHGKDITIKYVMYIYCITVMSTEVD